jgi:hypothetical protein
VQHTLPLETAHRMRCPQASVSQAHRAGRRVLEKLERHVPTDEQGEELEDDPVTHSYSEIRSATDRMDLWIHRTSAWSTIPALAWVPDTEVVSTFWRCGTCGFVLAVTLSPPAAGAEM